MNEDVLKAMKRDAKECNARLRKVASNRTAWQPEPEPCPVCGKEVTAPKSGYKRKTCSKECSAILKSRNLSLALKGKPKWRPL